MMSAPKLTGGSLNWLSDPPRPRRPTLGIPRIVNHRFPCVSSASDEGWITNPAGSAGGGGGGGGGGGFSTTHPTDSAAARQAAIMIAVRDGRFLGARFIWGSWPLRA